MPNSTLFSSTSCYVILLQFSLLIIVVAVLLWHDYFCLCFTNPLCMLSILFTLNSQLFHDKNENNNQFNTNFSFQVFFLSIIINILCISSSLIFPFYSTSSMTFTLHFYQQQFTRIFPYFYFANYWLSITIDTLHCMITLN